MTPVQAWHMDDCECGHAKHMHTGDGQWGCNALGTRFQCDCPKHTPIIDPPMPHWRDEPTQALDMAQFLKCRCGHLRSAHGGVPSGPILEYCAASQPDGRTQCRCEGFQS